MYRRLVIPGDRHRTLTSSSSGPVFCTRRTFDIDTTPIKYRSFMALNPLSFPAYSSQDVSQELSSPISPTSPVHISSSSSVTSTTSDDDLADQQWRESLAELGQVFNLVLLPFIGKYFGRKFAYFSIRPVRSRNQLIL